MSCRSHNIFGDMKKEDVVFFMCDMQERFRNAISDFSDIVEVSNRLIKGAEILKIPLYVTEQYPKGLGNTVSELSLALEIAFEVVPKTKFSMVSSEIMDKIPNILKNGSLRQIVLFGIETHVCIQQTAIDLLKMNYEVFIIADATSSRSNVDRKFAFERLKQAGAIITTAESVLLQLVGDKENTSFKEIQALIKTSAPQAGL